MTEVSINNFMGVCSDVPRRVKMNNNGMAVKLPWWRELYGLVAGRGCLQVESQDVIKALQEALPYSFGEVIAGEIWGIYKDSLIECEKRPSGISGADIRAVVSHAEALRAGRLNGEISPTDKSDLLFREARDRLYRTGGAAPGDNIRSIAEAALWAMTTALIRQGVDIADKFLGKLGGVLLNRLHRAEQSGVNQNQLQALARDFVERVRAETNNPADKPSAVLQTILDGDRVYGEVMSNIKWPDDLAPDCLADAYSAECEDMVRLR